VQFSLLNLVQIKIECSPLNMWLQAWYFIRHNHINYEQII